jgi:hydrogenase maturation protease
MHPDPDGAGDWLVIGVGNRDRGDDAVGPHVCELLRARFDGRLRSVVCEGSIIDLALHWGPGDRVVVVDALPPGTTPGRTITIDVTDDGVSAPAAVSTHEVDVSVAIELARALGRMPSELVVIGIEAEQVDWCAPLSPAVVDAATATVEQLAERLIAGQPAANVTS